MKQTRTTVLLLAVCTTWSAAVLAADSRPAAIEKETTRTTQVHQALVSEYVKNLVRLELEETALTSRVGDKHPELMTVRAQIQRIKKDLATLEADEPLRGAQKVTQVEKEDGQATRTSPDVSEAHLSITGEVKHPGRYPFASGKPLLAFISQAGGFTPYAKTATLTIIRDGTRTSWDQDGIMQGKIQNPHLKPGDLVLVKRKAL